MPTRSIRREALDPAALGSVFPYDDYRAWGSDRPSTVGMSMLHTSLVELRPRSEWNRLGREVYDRSVVARHAHAMLDALSDHALGGRWLVRLADLRPWFPPRPGTDPQTRRLGAFLGGHAPMPLAHWDGGFLVEGELQIWLPQLVDYPFVMKRPEVEIVGLDLSVLLRLTHHLDIQVFARDAAVLDGIEARVCAAGIRTQRVAYPPSRASDD